jgi:hypothetical protein
VVASAVNLLKESGQITEEKPLNAYYTNGLLPN